MGIPWDIGFKIMVPLGLVMPNNLFVSCISGCLQNLGKQIFFDKSIFLLGISSSDNCLK